MNFKPYDQSLLNMKCRLSFFREESIKTNALMIAVLAFFKIVVSNITHTKSYHASTL